MTCYYPLKGYKDLATGGLTFKEAGAGPEMEVSCGQCLGCRIDRSRMWAVRIVHESSLYEMDEGNCFITLTYEDKYLPEHGDLDKKAFPKFMKRLRKAYPQKIKFFHCGEYGSICIHGRAVTDEKAAETELERCDYCNVGRPHYHAILFNIDFRDRVPVGKRNGVVYYTSPTLQKFWKFGHVQVGDCNYQSAAYVARYCIKKVNGKAQEDWYTRIDPETGEIAYLQPEYITMSRGGRTGRGIAYDWYKEFKDDLFPSDEVPVPGQGVFKKVPRYYEEIYKSEDPKGHEEIKEMRKLFKKHHAEEYSENRLRQKRIVKEAQVRQLKRSQ